MALIYSWLKTNFCDNFPHMFFANYSIDISLFQCNAQMFCRCTHHFHLNDHPVTWSPRLDELSAAIKLLRKRFDNGEISEDNEARSNRMTDPMSMEYKLDNFRTRYDMLKREYFPDDGEF